MVPSANVTSTRPPSDRAPTSRFPYCTDAPRATASSRKPAYRSLRRIIWLPVPSGSTGPLLSLPITFPLALTKRIDRVGYPNSATSLWASTARSASIPLACSVSHDPTSSAPVGCASNTSAWMSAFCSAIAATGPATPAPITTAVFMPIPRKLHSSKQVSRYDEYLVYTR